MAVYLTRWRTCLRRADIRPLAADQLECWLTQLVEAGLGVVELRGRSGIELELDLLWEDELLGPVIEFAEAIRDALVPGCEVVLAGWGEANGDRRDLVITADGVSERFYSYQAEQD